MNPCAHSQNRKEKNKDQTNHDLQSPDYKIYTQRVYNNLGVYINLLSEFIKESDDGDESSERLS